MCNDRLNIWILNTLIILRNTHFVPQQLESVSWSKSGKQFMSAHNDGTHITWSTSDPTKQDEATKAPYGMPSTFLSNFQKLLTRPICSWWYRFNLCFQQVHSLVRPLPSFRGTLPRGRSIVWKFRRFGVVTFFKFCVFGSSFSNDFVIFSGGLPRASYGDRHAVTVIQGDKHEVLDFTSKVIDFFTISDNDDECGKHIILEWEGHPLHIGPTYLFTAYYIKVW